jgi:GT2 family glycosyltransferase
MRASEGALVLLLNPDTVILNRAIDRIAEHIDSSPSVGACCPMLLHADGRYQRSTLPLPVLLSPLYEHSTLFERVPALARLLVPNWVDAPYQIHQVGYSSGACLLVKRACIQEVGLFDEDFFLYGEDVDWCRRMHERGWQIIYYPDSRVIHHEGGSQEPDLNRRLREMEGEVRYLRKWHSPAYAAGYRALVWVLSLFRYIKLRLQRRLDPDDEARLSLYIAFYRTLLLGRHQIARPARGDDSSAEGLAHHSESGQSA